MREKERKRKSEERADGAVLEMEIITAMQLMGVTKLDELRPEMVQGPEK